MRKSQYVIQQRQQDLLALLARNGRMMVGELSDQLQVSDITVRRDLDLLSRAGVVDRFHGGGALPGSMVLSNPYFTEKMDLCIHEKARVAAAAAALVADGETVTLNAGTTTLEVIRLLKDRDVRIITNNAMASSVHLDGRAELICTGGAYNDETRAYTGEYTSHALNKVTSDMCILGASGVHANSGVTTTIFKETFINGLMATRCRGKVVIVADGSKIGKIYSFLSLAINRVHTLVTDSQADAAALECIRAAGITVILASE